MRHLSSFALVCVSVIAACSGDGGAAFQPSAASGAAGAAGGGSGAAGAAGGAGQAGSGGAVAGAGGKSGGSGGSGGTAGGAGGGVGGGAGSGGSAAGASGTAGAAGGAGGQAGAGQGGAAGKASAGQAGSAGKATAGQAGSAGSGTGGGGSAGTGGAGQAGAGGGLAGSAGIAGGGAAGTSGGSAGASGGAAGTAGSGGAAGTCGDGATDVVLGEECDDANGISGDGCDANCQYEPVGQSCGDGTQGLLEKCDDANVLNGDACNPTCNLKNATSLFAGSPGSNGPPKDGIGAAAVLSGTAAMIATDSHLYLAESGSWLIRRIEIATADVKTIAGNGTQGSTDHPTDPLQASFQGQGGLATDGTTLWISDGRRLRSMRLDGQGGVSTVAGSATAGCADGVGAAAQLNDTRALAYHKGFIYMVDATCRTLRRFDPATGDVKTMAGGASGTMNGFGLQAQFVSPRYLAADQAGFLYIVDTNGNQLRAYDVATTEVTTVAGEPTGACGLVDGVGPAARFNRIRGLTTDGTSLYTGEQNAYVIRQTVVSTKSVTTLAGTAPACTITCTCPMPPPAGAYQEGVGVNALFNNPFSLAFHYPSSSLFVLDAGNRVVRRIQ